MLWGHDDDGMCGTAALVQAIDVVRGRSVANLNLQKLRTVRPSIGSLSGMPEVLQQVKSLVPSLQFARMQLHRVNKCPRSAFEKAPYNCLAQQKGCFVVQF